jgi:hypothetical protein
MLKGFPSLSKLSNRDLLWMQHLAKEGHEVGAGLKPAPTVFCALCIAMFKSFLRLRKFLSSQSRKFVCASLAGC